MEVGGLLRYLLALHLEAQSAKSSSASSLTSQPSFIAWYYLSFGATFRMYGIEEMSDKGHTRKVILDDPIHTLAD